MAKTLRPKRVSKRTKQEKRGPSSNSRSTIHKPTVRKSIVQKDEAQPYEAEVLEGLVPFAVRELEGVRGLEVISQNATSIQFRFIGNPEPLRRLRLVVAVYRLESFAIPRPKALLGHEHWTRFLEAIEEVKKQDTFTSFRFSAAGSDSKVFARLAQEVEKATGLRHNSEEGDLLLRVRKSKEGWNILLRTTPRPLSSRPWRVCNLAGGLNATLAAATLELVGVKPEDRVFNAMCGSGTLLIERGLRGQAARLVGCDMSSEALACSRENIQESNLSGIELLQADATSLPLEDTSFDVIVADVPWGDAVGTHRGNAALYPAFLAEMARVAAPGARLAVLTHEIKLFEKVLRDFEEAWQLQNSVRVFHGGHYPRIYLFTKV